jgi:hypothetical protein
MHDGSTARSAWMISQRGASTSVRIGVANTFVLHGLSRLLSNLEMWEICHDDGRQTPFPSALTTHKHSKGSHVTRSTALCWSVMVMTPAMGPPRFWAGQVTLCPQRARPVPDCHPHALLPQAHVGTADTLAGTHRILQLYTLHCSAIGGIAPVPAMTYCPLARQPVRTGASYDDCAPRLWWLPTA